MRPIWGRQEPGGPHVGPMNFAIWEGLNWQYLYIGSGNGLVPNRRQALVLHQALMGEEGALLLSDWTHILLTRINFNPSMGK